MIAYDHSVAWQREGIPDRVVQALLREFGYHCPFCLADMATLGLSTAGRGEIAHCPPYSATGRHEIGELSRLCAIHHRLWDQVAKNPTALQAQLRLLREDRTAVSLDELTTFLADCWDEHSERPSLLLRRLWSFMGQHAIRDDEGLLRLLASEAEALRRAGLLYQAIDLLGLIDIVRWKRRPARLQVDLLATRARTLACLGATTAAAALARKALLLAEDSPGRHASILVVLVNSLVCRGDDWPTVQRTLDSIPWRTTALRRDEPSLVGVLEFMRAQRYVETADWSRATSTFSSARDLLADAGCVRAQAMCTANIGRMHYRARDYALSTSLMEHAAAQYEMVEDRWGWATALVGEADARFAAAITDPRRADEGVPVALDRYRRAKNLIRYDQHLMPRLMDNEASAWEQTGDRERADALRQDAAGIRQDRPRMIGRVLVHIHDDVAYVQRLPVLPNKASKSSTDSSSSRRSIQGRQ